MLDPPQGLTLARPEIVSFRLIPSMVDDMGLCSFEGVFRRVMEACMSVLRTNKETLLSVLEPFLQAREQAEEGCRGFGPSLYFFYHGAISIFTALKSGPLLCMELCME